MGNSLTATIVFFRPKQSNNMISVQITYKSFFHYKIKGEKNKIKNLSCILLWIAFAIKKKGCVKGTARCPLIIIFLKFLWQFFCLFYISFFFLCFVSTAWFFFFLYFFPDIFFGLFCTLGAC